MISSSTGLFGKIDYVGAAKASDNSTYIAYLPRDGRLRIDLTALKMDHIKAWWYDPRTGEAVFVKVFNSKNQFNFFTAPSENDWLLVLDNNQLAQAAPGKL